MKEETPEDKFKKFEGDGVSSKAKLIGSELVMEPRGDKMCQNSIQRLKAIIKGQKVHKQRIVLKISYSGVKVHDEKTNEILYHHEVPQISFIASDDTDSRTFGYVCDVHNKAHQFICFKTNGPALEVMSIISTLFETVLEKKRQAEGGGGASVASPATTTTTSTTATTTSSKAPTNGDSNKDTNSSSPGKEVKSPFDDDFGKDVPSGDGKSAMNTSDLISSSVEMSPRAAGGGGGGGGENNNEFGGRGDRNAKGKENSLDQDGGITIKTAGSKKDIRSYFDDLKDLQISKADSSPPFHLIHSGVAAGDSGIMDSTIFSDYSVLSNTSGGMSRTNSAAQMSRANSGAGLSRTNSAGGALLFEGSHNSSMGGATFQQQQLPHPPSSLYFTPASSTAASAAATPMSPMAAFNIGGPPEYSTSQMSQQHQQPAVSQAMFIPGRMPGAAGSSQPTPNMMVPNSNHHHQHHNLQQGGPNGPVASPTSGPNAASFGSFFEPPHSNMIVGSAPMNQLSHHQMSQHARFSSSMVAGLHQRLGSSAASIQSTGSAGLLSRQTNPFDDEFFT